MSIDIYVVIVIKWALLTFVFILFGKQKCKRQ